MGACSIAANVVEQFIGNRRENFQNTQSKPNISPLGLFIFLIIYLTLVLLFGKYLWDEVMCKVITVCKPMPSLAHFLGLVLLIDLLLPSYR